MRDLTRVMTVHDQTASRVSITIKIMRGDHMTYYESLVMSIFLQTWLARVCIIKLTQSNLHSSKMFVHTKISSDQYVMRLTVLSTVLRFIINFDNNDNVLHLLISRCLVMISLHSTNLMQFKLHNALQLNEYKDRCSGWLGGIKQLSKISHKLKGNKLTPVCFL